MIRLYSQALFEMAVDVVTFGCRLNIVESDVIRREAERAGLQDTIVVNTCAVTNEAVAQARQTIRKLRRDRPDARIVVTGCAAQTQAQMFAQMGEVDRVLGNGDKVRFEAWRDTRTVFMAAESRCLRYYGVREWRRIRLGFQSGCRVRSCRCRMAAITVVPSASSLWPRQFTLGGDGRGSRSDDVLTEADHAEIVLTGVDPLTTAAICRAPKLGMLTKQILKHLPR